MSFSLSSSLPRFLPPPTRYLCRRSLHCIMLCAALLAGPTAASENSPSAMRASDQPTLPVAIAVRGNLPALPASMAELKFAEFFTMPIGPRGLVASAKLLALSGKSVRLVGYMARTEKPVPGMFILTPLPVSLGDEDESLSDDLPASSVFVHLDAANEKTLPYYPGLLQLTGTLLLGPFEELDGHVSTVRLQLDAALTQALLSKQSVNK